MITFPQHSVETAPEGSQPLLADMKAKYGRVSNVMATMADSSALLEGYLALMAIFEKAGFTAAERQVVYLVATVDNECTYCVAAHSFAARRALAPEVLAALRAGAPLPDAKLQALAVFTTAVLAGRGRVTPAEAEAFLAAGFARAQMLDLLVGIAMKVMSTYMNHLTHPPLDDYLASHAWAPAPALPAAAE
jgi:AhpD family alkylhydroperoxidase